MNRGTATGLWRRHGAISERRVSGDVISVSTGINRKSPLRTKDRSLMRAGGHLF